MGKQFVAEKNGLESVGAIRGPVPWSKPQETTQSVSRLGRTLGNATHGFQNESKPPGVAQESVDTAVNQ